MAPPTRGHFRVEEWHRRPEDISGPRNGTADPRTFPGRGWSGIEKFLLDPFGETNAVGAIDHLVVSGKDGFDVEF